MEQEHLDRIEEDYMYLSVCMRENIKRLVKYLVEKNTIDSIQEEDILDEASDTLKSQTLLDYLLEKDEEAFNNFYEGCLHSHMWKAADILEPEKGPHQPKEEDIEEFLPENWPTESHFDVIKDPQALIIKRIGARHTQMMGTFEKSKKSDGIYDLSQKVKGRVLIINNEKFLHHDDRYGSDYDRAGLDYLFSQLSFEIRVEHNLTADSMRQVMKQEAGRDHSPYNCFVLAILSYGHHNDKVLGTDGKEEDKKLVGSFITLEEIKGIFAKVPSLVNKPKVFLIEAEPVVKYVHERQSENQAPGPGSVVGGMAGNVRHCGSTTDSIMSSFKYMQGQQPEYQAPGRDSSGRGLFESVSDCGLNATDSIMSRLQKTMSAGFCHGLDDSPEMDYYTEADGPSSSFGGAAANIAPAKADSITAVGTVKERLQHQGKPCGSWFIQAFIYIVANYAFQNDLQTLIQKVNGLTVQRRGMTLEQAYTSASTLNKKLYFFPGLPLEA